MVAWLIEKWDWWIYWRFYRSLRRRCERDGGYAYLMELWLREWRSNHPLTPEVEHATERFFESLRDYRGSLKGTE
jgi:hypothetical protein